MALDRILVEKFPASGVRFRISPCRMLISRSIPFQSFQVIKHLMGQSFEAMCSHPELNTPSAISDHLNSQKYREIRAKKSKAAKCTQFSPNGLLLFYPGNLRVAKVDQPCSWNVFSIMDRNLPDMT